MVITADKQGRADSVFHSLLQKINSPIPIVLVNWVEGFEFNEKLLKLKDYVLFCYCEYGWDFDIKESHIWGTDKGKTERYSGGNWDKFNDWVKENPFKILFKRELLAKDVTDTIKPIEYPCITNLYPIQSRQEFNNRIINVFQYWGRSNEHRLRIHGEIWLHAYKKGFQPCDNIYYLNNYLKEEQGEKWVTLWMPHYFRIDINNILEINNLSKLSLSWSGAGFKCFRTAEAPVNSVMVQWKNNMAWSYQWNETNCILVDKFKEIEGIEEALKREDLYNVYVNGLQNIKNYHISNYIPNYIEANIKKVCE